jgi:lysophospholipase L1-like esterase
MDTEYVLSYTGSEIEEKLGKIDSLATKNEVPTKTSELTNDSGFITDYTETDPTVPAWAKASTKPTYTASEVGADASGTASSLVSTHNSATDAHSDIREMVNNLSLGIADKEQLTPEFANSIDECTDTTKLYVLPDGYIYAYIMTTVEGEVKHTNLANTKSSDWLNGYKYNASHEIDESGDAGAFVSNNIYCVQGDILRIKGVKNSDNASSNGTYMRIKAYDASGIELGSGKFAYYLTQPYSAVGNKSAAGGVTISEDGVYSYEILLRNSSETVVSNPSFSSDIAYVRISGVCADTVDDVIITVNEEILVSESIEEHQWTNTGHAFVPSDYEDRIMDLEVDVATLKTDIADLKENSNSTTVVKSGANWFAFGDSITQGYISYIKDDGTPGSKLQPAAKHSWVYKVAELNGYTVTNYGVGGTGYAYGSPNASTTAREQVDAVDFTDCDLVTLAWGCNDWKYNGGAVGTVDDDKDTDTTPCASLKYVIEKIQSQNPLCKIIVLTPINVCYWGTFEGNYGLSHSFSNTGTLEDFFNAIVSVCKYYGVEYIDNTHNSIFNRVNIKSLLLDGVHPTPEAYVVMAKELAKKINFV